MMREAKEEKGHRDAEKIRIKDAYHTQPLPLPKTITSVAEDAGCPSQDTRSPFNQSGLGLVTPSPGQLVTNDLQD